MTSGDSTTSGPTVGEQIFEKNLEVLRVQAPGLARRVREMWYDPRYGCYYDVHMSDNAGYQTYTPPTSGRGNDWVLVLEGVRSAVGED